MLVRREKTAIITRARAGPEERDKDRARVVHHTCALARAHISFDAPADKVGGSRALCIGDNEVRWVMACIVVCCARVSRVQGKLLRLRILIQYHAFDFIMINLCEACSWVEFVSRISVDSRGDSVLIRW